MYDVIVVGARVAGSPTAMLLARKGYRVLLVDRDRFPSDKMSTHYIQQPGVAALDRWGLLDRVLATGCPPIKKVTYVRAGIPLSGMTRSGLIDFEICPRRTALDAVLVEAAVEAGAELRDGFVVEDVLREGDAVVGIRGHAKGGPTVEERARVVVGADGLHSLIARAVGAPAYNARPALACAYYAYYGGVIMDGAEVHSLDDCTIFAFPTNDGQTCIAVEWPNDRFGAVKQDYEGAFDGALGRVPGLAARVARGWRATRFTGTGDLPNYFRKPYGAGWALVGDAGYHRDPATGLGIMDAFLDAETLVDALVDGLADRQPLAQTLAGYEERRNARAMPAYEMTLQAASFQPPDAEEVELLKALRGNQGDTDRFLGLTTGITPLDEFMAPENVGRIIAQAHERAVASTPAAA